MRYFFAKQQIPKSWTGEQALAVADLLDVISTAVWEVHVDKILDAMDKRNGARRQMEEPRDEDYEDPF